MSNLMADVFDETEQSEETTEAVVDEQPEVETEEEATVEDDATTTVAEQDEAEPQEPEPEKEKDDWAKAAYLDEKQKRQALEARLAELESQKDQPEAPDPEEYVQRGEVNQVVAQAIFQERLTTHYEDTKAKYEDFSEMEVAFAEMAKVNPGLKQQFLQAKNPAEFAYVQAKNAQLLSQYGGNIQAMLDAVRKEQSIAEPKEPEAKKPVEKPKKTPSLATATESEKNTAPEVKMTTLDELFADYPL